MTEDVYLGGKKVVWKGRMISEHPSGLPLAFE